MELNEMKKELLPDYESKFNKLMEIAFELHKLGYTDVETEVLKKAAGIKLLIDHCKQS